MAAASTILASIASSVRRVFESTTGTALVLLALYAALFAPQLTGLRSIVPIDALNDNNEPWAQYFPVPPHNTIVWDAVTQHVEWASELSRRVRAGDFPE